MFAEFLLFPIAFVIAYWVKYIGKGNVKRELVHFCISMITVLLAFYIAI